MKRIDLIIPYEHLIEINKVLHKHKAGGMTFYDIRGRGRTKYEPGRIGKVIVRYVPEFVSRTKIEVLVADTMVKPVIDDIRKVISTSSASDGKIFVYDVSEAYDIRTTETGDSAI